MYLQKNHKTPLKYHKSVTKGYDAVLSDYQGEFENKPENGLTGRYIAGNIESLERFQNGQKKDDGKQDT